MKRVEWWVVITISVLITAAFLAFLWWAVDDSIKNSITQQSPEESQETQGFQPADISLEPVLDGLIVPTDIASTPDANDDRLFITERAGLVKIVQDGKILSGNFLDLSDIVINEGERGLLGLVFHPNYDQNGLFYINLVGPHDNGVGATRIFEYQVSEDDPNQADPESQRLVLEFEQPFSNHNGGDMIFDGNGNLYIGSGDGGSGADPLQNGQSLNTLLGKILRINPTAQEPYAIPENNPYAGQDDIRQEIWAYGLRNPWRISFDTDGQMYIGDVGQGAFEEINRLKPGEAGINFGWRCYEGPQQFSFENCEDDPNMYEFPLISYEHEGSQCTGSVTGGFVYRGQDYPELQGQYIYADYCTGKVFLASSEDEPQEQQVLSDMPGITSFGEDSNQELYAITRGENGGQLLRVTAE